MAETDVKLKQEKPVVAFTAVSIEDEEDRNKIERIFSILEKQGKIPADFIRPKFLNGDFDFHMTITLGELPMKFKVDLGKETVLNIEFVGISDSAVALGVSGDYFSTNKYQHITLAFKNLPEDSKNIENWISLSKPFKLNGIIREFTSKKEIVRRGVFDETFNRVQIGNFPAEAPPAGNGSMFPYEKK